MGETVNIKELNELIASKSAFISTITMGMDRTIVGQKHLVDSLLIGLLSNGHILLEGVPGLAKTTAAKTMTEAVNGRRVYCVVTDIYGSKSLTFSECALTYRHTVAYGERGNA